MAKRWLLAWSTSVLLLSCAGARVFGLPLHGLREEPPPELATKAVGVGASAPSLSLPSSGGGVWTLSEQLLSGPAVLLFYRGHW